MLVLLTSANFKVMEVWVKKKQNLYFHVLNESFLIFDLVQISTDWDG